VTVSLLDRAARAAVVRLGRRLDDGGVVLHEAGTQTVLGDDDAPLHVVVHDPRIYGALRSGSRGLGESYIRGWWDCDDLTGLVRLLLRNLTGVGRVLDRAGTAARPLLDAPARLRRPDKRVDRRNIRAHYDIGNDFYALMLDETMTYSCGLFERPDSSLADAQTAKLDLLCRRLVLSPSDHVVEIGTGWGSFAVHAASRYGCRVTTTTISAAQHELATKRVADAGLADRVTVLGDDYRDLAGTYDKLVSIEMIEAVDWRDHGRFFTACADLLRPDGLAALQAIVIADASFERAKHHDDFIRRYIFPGGCLPSITSIAAAATPAGFRILEVEDIGRHYAETLSRWRTNVERHGREIAEMGLDTEFRRMWDLYLAYCEAAFLERHVSDVQVLLAKPGWRAQLATEEDGSPATRR
jgi:cyclopropane-fatty-acyl-phospholipid synthase